MEKPRGGKKTEVENLIEGCLRDRSGSNNYQDSIQAQERREIISSGKFSNCKALCTGPMDTMSLAKVNLGYHNVEVSSI
jgi:hypothetical protein